MKRKDVKRKGCGKQRFDRVGALLALAEAQRKGRRELRVYWCRYCRAYHLTSEVKRGTGSVKRDLE